MRFSNVIKGLPLQYLGTAIGGCLGLLVGILLLGTLPKSYESTSTLYVSAASGESAQALSDGASYVQSQMKSYPLLASAPRVFSEAARQMGTQSNPAELPSRVRVTVPQDSTILQITAESQDLQEAPLLANAYGRSMADYIKRIETRTGSQTSPVTVTLAKPATEPASPSFPQAKTLLSVGLVLGALIGFTTAWLVSWLRRVPRSS